MVSVKRMSKTTVILLSLDSSFPPILEKYLVVFILFLLFVITL
jgi:hypothetical protein